MGNPLRDRRRPQELADSRQVIEISNKIGDFTELAGIVRKDLEALGPVTLPRDWREARVVGRLEFGFADAQRQLPAATGRVAVTIDAVCQRCLEVMQLPLDVELRLVFGGVTAGADTADGYEVWELDEERLRPLDLVDEVLVMAMPISVRHAGDDKCRSAGEYAGAGETTRPFANLKSQMDREC
jgi:uncharacterized metal-binding protein YceD (DUF177 family)